jgi:hypothetical protein
MRTRKRIPVSYTTRTVVLWKRIRDSNGRTHRLPKPDKMVLEREKYTDPIYYEKVMAKAKQMYPGEELEPILHNPPETKHLIGWGKYIAQFCTKEAP